MTAPAPPASAPPALVVVLGVSGAGKTTVGQAMAARLGWAFRDADAVHPAESVAKMARGEGLTDADREPWLDALNGLLRGYAARGEPLVLACSALKERYRERLAAGLEGAPLPLRWVWLDADADVLARRLAAREGHFVGPALLPSQFAAFEPPDGALHVAAERPVAEVVDAVVGALRAAPGAA